jgi:opacity protein-like surface antigen
MLRSKSMLAAAVCAVVVAGASASAAFAGEVTGNGKATAGLAHANSICVFSGKNDDPNAPLDGGPNGPGGPSQSYGRRTGWVYRTPTSSILETHAEAGATSPARS